MRDNSGVSVTAALGVFLLLYRTQLQPAAIRQVSRREWLTAIVVGILAGGVAPALIFQALGTSNVNNIILLGRLEQPLTLLLSIWLLGERINRWEKIGTIGSLMGIFLTIALLCTSTCAPIDSRYYVRVACAAIGKCGSAEWPCSVFGMRCAL